MTQEIKVILDSNSGITDEVKDNLLELISIFNDSFEDVDLSNLKERLKTLKIKRESMYLVKLPCEYKPFKNEIVVNVGRFENCDAKRWLMRALLGIITAKENYYGFNNSDNTFVAMNNAYTELIVNNLVGDVDNNYFTDEIIMTNLIGRIIGEDILYDAYFNNGSEEVLKAMIEKRLLDVNRNMNAYSLSSHLGDSPLYDNLLSLGLKFPELDLDFSTYPLYTIAAEGNYMDAYGEYLLEHEKMKMHVNEDEIKKGPRLG